MYDEKVTIELSKEEAIVFFEFLARFNESDDLRGFEDQAEKRVLWNIACILEKNLSEPLRADYQELVKNEKVKNILTKAFPAWPSSPPDFWS